MTEKDFSYESGERQTGTDISQIREDHLARYMYAVKFLTAKLTDRKNAIIGDIFCGNGYGSWLVAKTLGAKTVHGIDGSKEAIKIAKKHYSLPASVFENRIFPFDIPKEHYDAIICFESIEHINEPEKLFATLASGLKKDGYLVISTPNNNAIPLHYNQQWFKHHVKHFSPDEIGNLAESQGLSLVHGAGQNMYKTNDIGIIESRDLKMAETLTAPKLDDDFLILVFQKGKQPEQKNHADKQKNLESEYPDEVRVLDPSLLKREKICLDIGCGGKGPKTPEFIGVDIRELPGVGIISDAWSMHTVLPENCVDEIYTRHVMEHLTYSQFNMTLSSWIKILKPEGRVNIIVPDLLFHIHQFLDPNFNGPSPTNPAWTQRQHALAGFYGWQNEGDTKLWDVHKSGYTFEIMGGLLAKHGFRDIIKNDDKPWNLNVTAIK